MSLRAEVVVVGGGVIGLSLAYELAKRDVDVLVLDQGELGKGASWAGAGMLAPPISKAPADPLGALRDLSIRLHAEWALELRERVGMDNGYRVNGGLEIAVSESEAIELREDYERWRDAGVACDWLEGGELAELEPGLAMDLVAGVSLPGKGQIRNPWHIRALAAAVEKEHGRLVPCSGLESVVMSGSRLIGLKTRHGRIGCEQAVIAAGAWTGPILAGFGVSLATPPVKGQIVLLNAGQRAPERMIEHGTRYLVPRQDGRVLVGSTEEHVGFDMRSTREAVQALKEEAFRLCPALLSCEVEAAWAGPRPGSMDALPYLGPVQGHEGLFVAAGHFRAGLQLSTGTALMMAALMRGETPILDPRPFALEREPVHAAPLFRS